MSAASRELVQRGNINSLDLRGEGGTVSRQVTVSNGWGACAACPLAGRGWGKRGERAREGERGRERARARGDQARRVVAGGGGRAVCQRWGDLVAALVLDDAREARHVLKCVEGQLRLHDGFGSR